MNDTNKLKTFCKIDLDAIKHNYNYIKSKTQRRVICVVKANAYGHGAVRVAKALTDEGCDFFAVSSFEEAMGLREGGIDCSILVLGLILPCHIEEAIENNISFAVASLDFAKLISEVQTVKKAKVHIKLNTGMNRTGFDITRETVSEDLREAVSFLRQNKNIEVEGVFSHFAKAENDTALSGFQYKCFEKGCNYLKDMGINPKIRHICNSAGTINFENMHLDATRLGIYLYGCETEDKNLIPAMQFFTRIVGIQDLNPGDGVSYGHDFIADRKMRIAIIGAGYADGLFRCLSNGKGEVLCHGKRCPIIGRVCMDMAMIDISEVSKAQVLDLVTIWGENEGEKISCDEQAKNAGTIAYELLCDVSPRVARVY